MTFFPFTSQSRVRHQRQFHSRAGVTLIELIVTCALTVIFMSGVAMILPSALKLYNQVRGITYAQQVSGVVLNKIRGELEGAQQNSVSVIYDAEGKGTAISFKNRNGNEATIALTDAANPGDPRWFVERYASYTIKQMEGAENQVTISSLDWVFDEHTYMGFSVLSLTFSMEANNTVFVTLELISDKYGTYQAKEYIKMYNYEITSEFQSKASEFLTDYRTALNNLPSDKTYTDINSIDGKYVSYRASIAEAIDAAKGESGEHIYCHISGNTILCFAYSDGMQYIVWTNGKWGDAKQRGED